MVIAGRVEWTGCSGTETPDKLVVEGLCSTEIKRLNEVITEGHYIIKLYNSFRNVTQLIFTCI